MIQRIRLKSGFTLLEFLLVIGLFGVLLSMILPRAVRATRAAKFSMVRQYGSEIASYTVTWAQNQVARQDPRCEYSVKDFLMAEVSEKDAGFDSAPLVDQYTGGPNFQGVARLVPREHPQVNPFNELSYFKAANDDTPGRPSRKPGLLYLASVPDPSTGDTSLDFYFIYTDMPGSKTNGQASWYGEMDPNTSSGLRRGIFVIREPNAPTWVPPEPNRW